MSEIWMDPVELESLAGTLAQQAVRIRDAVAGVNACCDCQVPRSLVGWVDDELVAIAEGALQAAVGYLEEALDSKIRADEIVLDQSLAASQPALGQPSMDLASVLAGGAVVGGSGPAFEGPGFSVLPTTVGGPVDYAAGPLGALGGMNLASTFGGSSAGPSFVDVLFNSGDATSTILAPPGLSYNNGAYVDEGGDRSTSLASAYEDPYTGELDF